MAENLWAWLSADSSWSRGLFPVLRQCFFGGSSGGALPEVLWCSLAGTTSACSWEMTSFRAGCPARLSLWPCWAPTPCSRSSATTTPTSTAATTSASSASHQTTRKSWRTKWSSCTRATGKQRAPVWALACFRYHLGASGDVKFCSGVLNIFWARLLSVSLDREGLWSMWVHKLCTRAVALLGTQLPKGYMAVVLTGWKHFPAAGFSFGFCFLNIYARTGCFSTGEWHLQKLRCISWRMPKSYQCME